MCFSPCQWRAKGDVLRNLVKRRGGKIKKNEMQGENKNQASKNIVWQRLHENCISWN